MRPELPAGTVTFLFTDVEGSTRLLHDLGAERYAEALAGHRRVLREAFAAHGGIEVDTQGDAFFVAFPTAPGALAAAREALAGLSPGRIRVRIGIHTGTPYVTDEGYVGADVHRAARIAAVGHGGQVLVSATTAVLVGRDGLHDLGEHRLKDLSAPERIYQLGDAEFPPLTSLHRTNLPVPATPFLGRERERTDVHALLSRDDVRLVTLTGPGGTGKTRLALQAAADASDRFPGGVFWVPLASLRDPGLVLETAATALGAEDGLAEQIGDRTLLLYLDNFEHLLAAAEDLLLVLQSCPNLHVLVTSREVLRVPGEQAYPVPPLEAEDGTELFLARAHAVDPAFAATAAVPKLCARLEQLPLALELAAARVRLLSPDQLLDRLSGRLDLLKAGRGVDPRQQTLRATIEWSHDLLDEHERRLFAQLAIFSGGCTLEATEAVCEADLDVLQSLVDKSLVRIREEGRFWMLETIREYAAERLADSGESEELRRRHAQYFLGLAAEAEPHLRAVEREWHERLGREHDNLRAASDYLEERGDWQLALRLSGALAEFWATGGHLTEGLRRLEAALAGDDRPTLARVRALNGLADLAYGAGRLELCRACAEEALELSRRLGSTWDTATAVSILASLAGDAGDMARARELWEESAGLYRETGDEHAALVAHRLVAWAHADLGEVERAIALFEETLRRARELGDEYVQAHCLDGLATQALTAGRLDEAATRLKEAYALYSRLGDRYRLPLGVARLAGVLAAAGKAAVAARVLSAAEATFAEMGARFPRWMSSLNDDALKAIHERLDDAAFAQAWEQGHALSSDEAVALALDALA